MGCRPDPDAIERAARLAEAAGFIEALPDRYDTLVGERSQRLSGASSSALLWRGPSSRMRGAGAG